MKYLFHLTVLLALVSCESKPKTYKQVSISDSIISEQLKADSLRTEPKQNWEYKNDIDVMTSDSMKFASVDANKRLQLRFPYDGGVLPTLTIRKKRGRTDVMVYVTKGQFKTSYSDNNYVRLRFDDEKPIVVGFNEPSDASTNIIFLNSEKKLISKLKSAKKLIVEAEFFQNGLQQMEFDVEGFQW